tara:strand:+ start:2652 stop:2942 length:291 start_codon:yes stop_codon:yes gene_type:complete
MPSESAEKTKLLVDEILGESLDPRKSLGVHSLMDDWFAPKVELIRHIVVIQMIACVIVSMFLLVTSGDDLNSEAMMVAVMGFFLFVAACFGLYKRM